LIGASVGAEEEEDRGSLVIRERPPRWRIS